MFAKKSLKILSLFWVDWRLKLPLKPPPLRALWMEEAVVFDARA